MNRKDCIDYRNNIEDNPIREVESIFSKVKKIYKNKINKKIENNSDIPLKKDIPENVSKNIKTFNKIISQSSLSVADVMAILNKKGGTYDKQK